MPKVPRGKRQVLVLLSEDVYKKLWELIRAKHERPYGALSYEVEEALKHWILEHTRRNQGSGTQDQEKIEASKYNPPPRYLKVWLQVKEYLERALKYDFNYTRHLLHEDLVRAVVAVRGPDGRTLKKWPRIFEEYGILKRVSPKLYEVKVS